MFHVFLPSATDVGIINPNYNKTLLTNGSVTFSINGRPNFIDDPRSLAINSPNVIILEICVFDN